MLTCPNTRVTCHGVTSVMCHAVELAYRARRLVIGRGLCLRGICDSAKERATSTRADMGTRTKLVLLPEANNCAASHPGMHTYTICDERSERYSGDHSVPPDLN